MDEKLIEQPIVEVEAEIIEPEEKQEPRLIISPSIVKILPLIFIVKLKINAVIKVIEYTAPRGKNAVFLIKSCNFIVGVKKLYCS